MGVVNISFLSTLPTFLAALDEEAAEILRGGGVYVDGRRLHDRFFRGADADAVVEEDVDVVVVVSRPVGSFVELSQSSSLPPPSWPL